MDAVVRTLKPKLRAEGIKAPRFTWFTDNRGNQLPKGHLIGTDAKNKGRATIEVDDSLYVDDAAWFFLLRRDLELGMKIGVAHFEASVYRSILERRIRKERSSKSPRLR